MQKPTDPEDDDLDEEYDLSRMTIIPKGRYAPHRRTGKNLIVLAPDVADAVLDILTWKDSARLAGACTLIAATRPGYDLSRLSTQPGAEAFSIEPMEVPALAISSTDIRTRIAARRPVRYLLPEAVATYVRKNRLYEGAA